MCARNNMGSTVASLPYGLWPRDTDLKGIQCFEQAFYLLTPCNMASSLFIYIRLVSWRSRLNPRPVGFHFTAHRNHPLFPHSRNGTPSLFQPRHPHQASSFEENRLRYKMTIHYHWPLYRASSLFTMAKYQRVPHSAATRR